MIVLTNDWLGAGEATALLVLIGLATLGTAALFAVAAAGTLRRRTTPYLLLTVAIGLLVARSLLGLGTALGAVPMPVHHLAGHGVDLTIALLVLAAVAAVDRPTSPD
jgi:membrane protein DedA with SNARE-associated domain